MYFMYVCVCVYECMHLCMHWQLNCLDAGQQVISFIGEQKITRNIIKHLMISEAHDFAFTIM